MESIRRKPTLARMRSSENVIILGRDVDGLSTHRIIGTIDPEESYWLGEGDKIESSQISKGLVSEGKEDSDK